MGWIKPPMIQRVPYNFTPPLKNIYDTTTIFRKPDLLGAEINNVAYYRIGNMLHIYIQKGEEAMKIEKFKKISEGMQRS